MSYDEDDNKDIYLEYLDRYEYNLTTSILDCIDIKKDAMNGYPDRLIQSLWKYSINKDRDQLDMYIGTDIIQSLLNDDNRLSILLKILCISDRIFISRDKTLNEFFKQKFELFSELPIKSFDKIEETSDPDVDFIMDYTYELYLDEHINININKNVIAYVTLSVLVNLADSSYEIDLKINEFTSELPKRDENYYYILVVFSVNNSYQYTINCRCFTVYISSSRQIESLRGKGMKHYYMGELENSMQCFQEILLLDPKNTPAAEYVEYLKNEINSGQRKPYYW